MSHETLVGGVPTGKCRRKKNKGPANKCVKCEEYRKKYVKYYSRTVFFITDLILLGLVIIAGIVLVVILTTNYVNIRSDVQELSQQCESAIDAVVAGTGDSGESLIEVRDSINAIKNKYSIE